MIHGRAAPCSLYAHPGCNLPDYKALLQSGSVLRGGEGAAAGPEEVPCAGERGEEALGRNRASEPPHSSLPDAGGLVCLLDLVVAAPCGADLLVIYPLQLRDPMDGGGIATQLVRVDLLRCGACVAEQEMKEALGSSRIPRLL